MLLLLLSDPFDEPEDEEAEEKKVDVDPAVPSLFVFSEFWAILNVSS